MQGAHRLGRLAAASAVVVAALTVLLAAGAHPAAACSCVRPSDWEAATIADAVIVGTRVDGDLDLYQAQMLLDVDQVVKGEVAARQGVLGDGLGCGPDVEADVRSLLFLDRDAAGRLRVMPCSPTRPVDASAEAVVFALGGHPPSPGSVTYAVGGPQDRRPLLLVVVGVLGLVGVLALIGRGLDRRAGRATISPPGGRPGP